jgi:hypothetical protein
MYTAIGSRKKILVIPRDIQMLLHCSIRVLLNSLGHCLFVEDKLFHIRNGV